MLRCPRESTLFPYTTLFRSGLAHPARLNLWDFGGQDVYHGSHALFLQGHAVFLLLWCPALESDRKSTRLNSSHVEISYAVFCLKKKNMTKSVYPLPTYEKPFTSFIPMSNAAVPPGIYSLSLHDALPIWAGPPGPAQPVGLRGAGRVPRLARPVPSGARGFPAVVVPRPGVRSEEHTSELQSRRDLVCRLLLEKKKHDEVRLPVAHVRKAVHVVHSYVKCCGAPGNLLSFPTRRSSDLGWPTRPGSTCGTSGGRTCTTARTPCSFRGTRFSCCCGAPPWSQIGRAHV